MEKKLSVELEDNCPSDNPNQRLIQNQEHWQADRHRTGELVKTGAAIAGLAAARKFLIWTALREVSHRMRVGCLLSDEQNQQQQL